MNPSEQETLNPETQEHIQEHIIEANTTNPADDFIKNPDNEIVTDEIVETAMLSKQISEWKDKFIRLSAEFDNFKKRTNKEKAELIRYGQEEMLTVILPMIDELQRSIRAAEQATDLNGLKKGLLLMDKNLRSNLAKKGVQEIVCLGEPLNPEEHDAIASIPTPETEKKGKILDIIETGFKFQEKVVRVSKVIVGE